MNHFSVWAPHVLAFVGRFRSQHHLLPPTSDEGKTYPGTAKIFLHRLHLDEKQLEDAVSENSMAADAVKVPDHMWEILKTDALISWAESIEPGVMFIMCDEEETWTAVSSVVAKVLDTVQHLCSETAPQKIWPVVFFSEQHEVQDAHTAMKQLIGQLAMDDRCWPFTHSCYQRIPTWRRQPSMEQLMELFFDIIHNLPHGTFLCVIDGSHRLNENRRFWQTFMRDIGKQMSNFKTGEKENFNFKLLINCKKTTETMQMLYSLDIGLGENLKKAKYLDVTREEVARKGITWKWVERQIDHAASGEGSSSQPPSQPKTY